MNGICARFFRKPLCAAVSAACAGAAVAGPVGLVVSSGRATYNPATLTLTSATARTQISWQSFNVAAGEVVRFVQPNAQSSVLNHVFNPYSLSVQGGASSNGSVLFMTNGTVSGAGANLDLAGLINTSLRPPQRMLAVKSMAFDAQIKPLTTLAGGRIYVIGQDEQAITSANGDWVLNPGKTVELANAAMPHLRVELTAPGAEAINISHLVGSKRETGIFAALFRAPAAARHAIDADADTVLTAAADADAPLTQNTEWFFRYAMLRAQMRSETPQDEGGMVKVAAASSRVVLPAAKSRPSLLPRAIELGALSPESAREAAGPPAPMPAPAVPEAVVTLEPQPIPVAVESERERNGATLLALAPAPPVVEPVATLEPQPIPVAAESERERNGATLLALAPAPPVVELVATLEPQPIPVAAESERERNGATLFALAPAPPVAKLVATLEPQPIPVRQEVEPEDVRSLASQPAAVQPLAQPETRLAAIDRPKVDSGQERDARKFAPTVIVVAALGQAGATPASRGGSNVKEIRVERRAPRFFTDYRGAIFHL